MVLERAAKLSPEQLHARALALLDLRRAGDAERVLADALAADPNDGEALRLMSYALSGQGNFQAALVAAERSVALLPGDANAVLAVVRAYRNLDRNGDAAELVRQAVRLAPVDPTAHAELVETMIKYAQCMPGSFGSVPDAHIAAANSAQVLLRIAPNSALTHIIQAKLHLAADNREQAIAAAEHALTIQPTNQVALQVIGLAHRRLSQRRKAAQYFADAVRLNPDSSTSRQLLRSAWLKPSRVVATAAVVSAVIGLGVEDKFDGAMAWRLWALFSVPIAGGAAWWYLRQRPPVEIRRAIRLEDRLAGRRRRRDVN
jgi:tetratricopeptide (TPR) repeat protein